MPYIVIPRLVRKNSGSKYVVSRGAKGTVGSFSGLLAESK
jgi:hypothetical protein